ncbi:argininosuccinate lyase [Reichenbachiella agariperforans]|uniref:Argininosuccinate lyase n=1 Tax=Reichenbachiella agariperforans TaxID=156994 RepID=A0A1M6SN52_REIAG|nr:argininosuccinate lyase [Reichenbachiella agariperforans]SHK46039.1 argininosuccinate lyase [Reichenbachiella agariperforans]
MKLWDKGNTEVSKDIENYTVGRDRELDLLLARFDVYGSMAHTTMLESIDLLTSAELTEVHRELKVILGIIEAGDFVIEDGIEDVHSQVELMLTRKLGDTGKKIHSGRSRNDQVLVDLRLFIRDEIKTIADLVTELFTTLNDLSKQHKDVLIPGYTHLQVAMPSSFGLWFGAYAESLTDDMHLLQAAYKVTNQNPLGSGAGYGSSFPLDRQMTTDLLGFDDLSYNVVYAQMSRGKVEKTVAFAMNSIASTLARMSMDICLYNSQNFGFLELPAEMTTGSSIMPHKKNPDVFELIRAKMNKLQSLSTEISLITTNLPSGYHRDMQTIKETFLPAFYELKSTLEIAIFAMKNIKVKDGIIQDEKYKDLFSVEEVNRLVLQGVPFRDAYIQVGQAIQEGSDKLSKEVKHTHLGSIGDPANDQIEAKLKTVLAGFGFEKAEEALKALMG